MSELEIIDKSADRKYFTMLPNMLDDIGLSPYALRLYLRLKRRAGEDGKCWENSRHLAEGCGMSRSQVTKAKRELVKASLITITKEPSRHGYFPGDVITIVDIWKKNMEAYSKSPVPVMDMTCPPDRPGPVHQKGHKKNPSEEEPSNENSKNVDTTTSLVPQKTKNTFSSGRNNFGQRLSPKSSTGLIDKVEEAIRAQGVTPDREIVMRAISTWQDDCEIATEDGAKWKVTNLDAILERYDIIAYRVKGPKQTAIKSIK